MKQLFSLVIAVFLPMISMASGVKSTASDPVVVEITDATLSSVYYHQTHFSVPTKLVFTNLTSVSGYIYFHQTTNLVEVDFPVLVISASYVYFHQNTSLQKINMPNLQTVGNYFYANGNTALTQLNICGLANIFQLDTWATPYYSIVNNTPAVDATPQCFSLGAPTNFTLSANTVAENAPLGTTVGSLSADSNYPMGTLTYVLDDFNTDNNKFHLNGNQLLTNAAFDFEADAEYTIHVKVFNQLGESVEQDFTINVTNVVTENVTVVEITDATLDNVYYHQVSFTTPTKLVFTNLTSVGGYVYFHQNPNLVAVEFPQLTQTGRYFYFHGNTSLESVLAPNLHTVHSYAYVHGNTSLTELNLCALTSILPGPDGVAPYYHVQNNTPAVDSGTPCFSLGGPTNLALSNNTVSENTASGAFVGTFSADTNYPSGTLTYVLDDSLADNMYFQLSNNQLLTHSAFDYETGNQYTVHVRVFNQLGESIEQDFVISVTDVAAEPVQVVYITDASLDNVYYHMNSFTQPTKLVFTNLASVGGYIYFHKNINLVEVDFPMLTQTGQYFYCYGNQSLTKISAPSLHTVHSYLYVSHHNVLTDLNICALANILPGSDSSGPYYYIQSNPILDLDTTCLTNTTISYTPADPVIVLPAPNTLIGTFSCDTTDPVTYYFVDANGNPTTNPLFVIVGNGLYLANEYNTYAATDFIINVGAIRVDNGAGRSNSAFDTSSGLNERTNITIEFNLSEVELGIGDPAISKAVIYPNPAADSFTISGIDVASVAMHDMLGRRISGIAVHGNTVNTSALPAGCYIVSLTDTDGKISSAKLVIRK